MVRIVESDDIGRERTNPECLPTANIFSIKIKGLDITKTILKEKIQVLRPQTITNDGSRMILVYLPTKKEIMDKANHQIKALEFLNSAYFVIFAANDSGEQTHIILPHDDPVLINRYKIDVLPEWNDVRWEMVDIQAWIHNHEPVDPAKLYNLMYRVSKKYIEFADETEYVKFILWNIGTYCFELFDAYPYNDYTGTKRAGKSKSLEFQKLVCYNAVMSPDITSSATFRIIEGLGATILLDETEQFKNSRNDQAQQVRTLLLQGFLKNQFAVRSEVKDNGRFIPTTYNIYSPKGLAHINAFDDVLEDRCIEQILKRALDASVRNTWPTSKDPAFQRIRNMCYRLFLDYASNISNLQTKARELLSISGRELQLWTPLITLALFFEQHGVKGLVDSIKQSVTQNSEQRQLLDEQESRDLRILSFLTEIGIALGKNRDIIKANPEGWIPIAELYNQFKTRAQDFEINTEYFTRNTLTQTLKRLGFKQAKKEAGISWLITPTEVNETKRRMGFETDMVQSDLTTVFAEIAETSATGTDNMNKTKHSAASEASEPKTTN